MSTVSRDDVVAAAVRLILSGAFLLWVLGVYMIVVR